MVISDEPGLYIDEEEIGIRIEDDLLITDDRLPRALRGDSAHDGGNRSADGALTFGGMGMKLKIQARAKINWTLDVVGTLPNGYHDLDMLMQSVTLCDQMTMEEAPQLSLYVRAQGRAFVPADGNNLVLKAAAALQAATGCTRGARITLKKYIPVAAGMGGGSSDAAAALVGLNRLWGLGLSADRLEEIGLTVGADVPFCVRGGLQRAQGVGERLTPLAMKKPLYLVAFQPCRGLSTKRGLHRAARGRHPRRGQAG